MRNHVVNDQRPIESALWRRSALVLAGMVLAALALETSIGFRFLFFGIEPSILLALVFYFARYQGAVPGPSRLPRGPPRRPVGAADLGLHALAKCLMGYGIGKLWAGQRLFKDNLRAQFLTLLAAGIAHDFLVLAVIARGHPVRCLLALRPPRPADGDLYCAPLPAPRRRLELAQGEGTAAPCAGFPTRVSSSAARASMAAVR